MDIQTFGVVGAGQMGSGIAHVAALTGFDVLMQDISDAALERGIASIRKNLARQVKKGRLDEAAADAALARVRCTTDVAAFADAQLVVEAATENVDLKFKIFEPPHRTRPSWRPTPRPSL